MLSTSSETLTTAADFFRKNNYYVLREALDHDSIQVVSQYAELQRKNNEPYFYDEGRQYSGRYGDLVTESILLQLQSIMSEITGCDLYPAFSFLRVYKKGDALHKHVDRNASEFAVTMTIAKPGEEVWPIYVESLGKEVEVLLNPGEILLYKGREMVHWRHKLEMDYWTQAMFFFVDSKGSFKDHLFDKRNEIGEMKNMGDLRFKMHYLRGLMATK
ncbi:MAG: hypothetical protein HEP71_11350 [Roseivirga sp.]|nr:hypothetical protein [Roseivirga sp.]